MRSMLFVPGDSERKLVKGLETESDALILDLEDSVGRGRKSAAREMVSSFLREHSTRESAPQLWVRINALDTSIWRDDVESIMAGRPAGLVLPKPYSGADVAALSRVVDMLEAQCEIARGSTQILAIATETPASILQMASYISASPRLTALSWGAEDLSAELGARATRNAAGQLTSPFRLARDLCLMAAVAANAAPLDTVYVDFRDSDGLQEECREAARDGFTGKLAVHPSQVAIINDSFTPSPEDIAWANQVIALLENSESGVASLDGQMIDRPHLRRAEAIRDRAGLRNTPRAG